MLGLFEVCKETVHAILCRMPVEYQGIPLSSIFSFRGFG